MEQMLYMLLSFGFFAFSAYLFGGAAWAIFTDPSERASFFQDLSAKPIGTLGAVVAMVAMLLLSGSLLLWSIGVDTWLR